MADTEQSIYKIATQDQWDAAVEQGVFEGAPVDLVDGYIHFSTAEQVGETLAKHFHGQENLLLITVPQNQLGEALKWEASRGGDLFPHLYAPLQISAASDISPIETMEDGSHRLPRPPL